MNFHEVCNIYGYNKSGLGNLKEGTKKNINWNNVIVDTTSGSTVGVIAGTGLGIGYIVAVGMSVGADNYVIKVAANSEYESKSLQEHIIDGAISSVVWGISAAIGGTMQKEVRELKEISKIINSGVYNIALAKAVQGGAYMGDVAGENMVDVDKCQYTEFIREMNVASIRTNLSATILSWFSDTALKEIKNKIYKKQNSNISDEELKDKFKKHINSATKKVNALQNWRNLCRIY